MLLPRQAVVAALQQRPEQLGRELVARHGHHSPGRADLLCIVTNRLVLSW
jgi:hypothetical protein